MGYPAAARGRNERAMLNRMDVCNCYQSSTTMPAPPGAKVELCGLLSRRVTPHNNKTRATIPASCVSHWLVYLRLSDFANKICPTIGRPVDGAFLERDDSSVETDDASVK